MSLHKATTPRDYRWHLTYVERTSTGTIIAVDDYGQRWSSTRHRRYASQRWECGHEMEQYRLDRQGGVAYNQTHYPGHSRYWLRQTKARGISSPTMLCEMTSTLNPHDHRHIVTPLSLAQRTA